jgi:hypothetical protein
MVFCPPMQRGVAWSMVLASRPQNQHLPSHFLIASIQRVLEMRDKKITSQFLPALQPVLV